MLEGDMITLPDGVRGEVVRMDDESFEIELGYGATRRVSWREVNGQRPGPGGAFAAAPNLQG